MRRREAGIEHFIFVTGRNKGVIEDHFDRQAELEMILARKGQNMTTIKLLDDLLPGPWSDQFYPSAGTAWAWGTPYGAPASWWADEPFALLCCPIC